MVTISVIIPTYNRANLLKNCLLSLFTQSINWKSFEIIVVDDGSSDQTLQLLSQFQKKIPNLVVVKQNHLGVTRARNLGIHQALAKIIAFTDDDCLLAENWLKNILLTFQKHPLALAIEGKTITEEEKITPLTTQIVNQAGKAYPTCNIAYRKEILKKIGGLDEAFLSPHCEDVDLALRVLKFGPIYFEPKAIVVHPPRPSTFKNELERVSRIPNEFRLFLKHPDYYQSRYRRTSLFLQVVLKNSLWIRLYHLKYYFPWLRKNLSVYLQFFIRSVLEILLIVFLLPKFWWDFRKMKRGFRS